MISPCNQGLLRCLVIHVTLSCRRLSSEIEIGTGLLEKEKFPVSECCYNFNHK